MFEPAVKGWFLNKIYIVYKYKDKIVPLLQHFRIPGIMKTRHFHNFCNYSTLLCTGILVTNQYHRGEKERNILWFMKNFNIYLTGSQELSIGKVTFQAYDIGGHLAGM
jgi:hypothetical protein